MSYLLLTPYDDLFFRDGKPFDAGTSQWISSMNMPFPSTIYGAIFTHLMRQNLELKNEIMQFKKGFTNKVKDEDKLENELIKKLESYLKIRNIYLYNKAQNTIYIPAPLDMFINEKERVDYGKFINEEHFCMTNSTNNVKLNYLMKNPKDYDRVDNYYISILNFISYYAKRQKEKGLLLSEDEIFTHPYKVGIKLNKARTSTEGHLYRIDTSQFIEKDFGFLIEYEATSKKKITFESGNIKLGGEGKLAELKTIDKRLYSIDKLGDYYENTTLKNNYIKLILITEGIFNITGFFPRIENTEVVCIVNDKPISIGGFDMLRNKYKPMLKANKRGCVYILKIQNGKGRSLKSVKEEIENSLKIDEENSFRGFNKFILSPFKGA